jgi:hypothetical protein
MRHRRRALRLLAGLAVGLVGGYAVGLVREPRPPDADQGASGAPRTGGGR